MIYGSRASVFESVNGHFVEFARQPGTAAVSVSFSEDDCTRQRGLKAVVQSSIERTVSGVRCTNDDLK
ncbi:hypothetical protein, partial [Aeromonas caviae]|uniref:hypothetical protein n=1 Tax=Aeromonas caviae TaxID=648 RepID=UPI004039FC89